jgi:hypothetical protein
MVEILRHSQTKGRDNRKLKHRPKQARLSSTLHLGRYRRLAFAFSIACLTAGAM